MFPQIRKVTGSAAIRRAIGGVSIAPSSARHHTSQHSRLFEAASVSTANNKSHWLPYSCIAGDQYSRAAARGVPGTMLFSVATTALVEELYAKEPVHSKFKPKDVVLYQYEACPFCNKVKAFLDYYDIPYKIVEVNPISKKEIKWSDYKKVPILMVDGEQMIDSSEIINKLIKNIYSDESTEGDDEENKWRGWVDNHLVHLLSPNIYRTVSEAIESFEYITTHGNFTFTERITAKYAGAAAMYLVSKKLKKRYNIIDERAALYEASETWVDALNDRDFLGGEKPNLADLAVAERSLT